MTDVDSNIRLFPDETSLLIIVENPDMAAKLLNIDFEKNYGMGQTLACNLLSYKNIISSFLKKINQPNHPPLFMDNQVIKQVTSHKHLGVYPSKTVHSIKKRLR